jgi:hypothetical protein
LELFLYGSSIHRSYLALPGRLLQGPIQSTSHDSNQPQEPPVMLFQTLTRRRQQGQSLIQSLQQPAVF